MVLRLIKPHKQPQYSERKNTTHCTEGTIYQYILTKDNCNTAKPQEFTEQHSDCTRFLYSDHKETYGPPLDCISLSSL